MMSCRRARRLIVEHVRGAVAEPTLLQLDLHLLDCPGCQAERARWVTVGSLRSWSPPTLTPAAQGRVLAQLRAARSASPIARPRNGAPRRLAWMAPALAGVALLVAAGVALRGWRPAPVFAPSDGR